MTTQAILFTDSPAFFYFTVIWLIGFVVVLSIFLSNSIEK